MATPPATSQPIRLLYNLVVAANSLIVSDLLDNPLHFLRRGLSVSSSTAARWCIGRSSGRAGPKPGAGGYITNLA